MECPPPVGLPQRRLAADGSLSWCRWKGQERMAGRESGLRRPAGDARASSACRHTVERTHEDVGRTRRPLSTTLQEEKPKAVTAWRHNRQAEPSGTDCPRCQHPGATAAAMTGRNSVAGGGANRASGVVRSGVSRATWRGRFTAAVTIHAAAKHAWQRTDGAETRTVARALVHLTGAEQATTTIWRVRFVGEAGTGRGAGQTTHGPPWGRGSPKANGPRRLRSSGPISRDRRDRNDPCRPTMRRQSCTTAWRESRAATRPGDRSEGENDLADRCPTARGDVGPETARLPAIERREPPRAADRSNTAKGTENPRSAAGTASPGQAVEGVSADRTAGALARAAQVAEHRPRTDHPAMHDLWRAAPATDPSRPSISGERPVIQVRSLERKTAGARPSRTGLQGGRTMTRGTGQRRSGIVRVLGRPGQRDTAG